MALQTEAFICRLPGSMCSRIPRITPATGWQKHTIRGFMSLLGSKGGLKIISVRNDAGERSYRIAK